MTITYPITLPTTPGFTNAQITARNAAGISESPFTFRQQVYQHQGQMWEAQLSLPPMKRAQAAAWVAALVSLGGVVGTFLLGDPDAQTARGIATGTPLVKGASQTGLTLDTDGWTINQTGIMLAGDYIQFGSGTTQRMHMITVDADSDGSGDSSLEIWPRIRESPNNGATITVQACKAAFRLASNDYSWDTDKLKLFGVSFSAMEAL